MAIKTSTFGGWTLIGKDAEAFAEQMDDSKPNKLAQTSYERGQKLLDEYRQKGYVRIYHRSK